MKYSAKFLILFIVLLCLHISEVKAFSLAVEQKIALIENYLNSITTFKAFFVQVDRQGGLSTGKFYLNRPGKVRMEYDLPNPNIIISNGNEIIHWDRELKQRTDIPSSSPIAIFLKKRISLKNQVYNYSQSKGVIRITLLIEDRPEKAILVFNEKPLLLKQWILKDDQDRTTEITLQNIECNMPIDPRVFAKIE